MVGRPPVAPVPYLDFLFLAPMENLSLKLGMDSVENILSGIAMTSKFFNTVIGKELLAKLPKSLDRNNKLIPPKFDQHVM